MYVDDKHCSDIFRHRTGQDRRDYDTADEHLDGALNRLGQLHDAARGVNLVRRFHEDSENPHDAELAGVSKESAVAIISLILEGLRAIMILLENSFAQIGEGAAHAL